MSFIQPFRTKVIKHGTISKPIRGRSSSTGTCPRRQYSTQQLAKDFASSVNNRNGTIQDDLVFALCILKRQLTFSSSVFVSHWLKHLEHSVDPTALVAFQRLASRLTSILSISCLIQQADSDWICSQCRMLLHSGQVDILADYLEAMMTMGDPLWMNRLCAKDRDDYCSCRPVQSPSMLAICLQVLQDPNKIPRLSIDKRRDIVIQFMQQVEEDKRISDDNDLAVMKKRLWQGAMRWKGDSISHLLASWYAECGSLAWPRLSLVLLKKPTLSLLLIYIGACQQLQQASHLARATELLGSLNTSLRDIISRGLPRREFQILLMLVQICLSYLSELLGMTYQGWFQHKFLDPKTTCFENDKRAFESFVKLLEEMIPTELSAILQIQGKAMNSATSQQGSLRQYVFLVKTRLMEFGVDHTLRHYPTSLQHPLENSQTQEMATSNSSVEDIIEHAMDLFEREQCIPKDLWENAIFKPRWFKMTFLPAFIVYPHRTSTRDSLLAALHDKKKISAATYQEYLRRNKPPF